MSGKRDVSPAHAPALSPHKADDDDRGKENTRPAQPGKSAGPSPPLSPEPAPVTHSASRSPRDTAPHLTEAVVKKWVQQQRLAEKQGLLPGLDRTDGQRQSSGPLGGRRALPAPQHCRQPTDPNSLAVNGAAQASPQQGPFHSRHATDVTPHRKSGSPDADGDAESEGEQVFLSPRALRGVLSYLDSLRGITFTDDPSTSVGDATDREQLEKKIRFVSRDKLRTMVLDYSEELTSAFDELLAMETKLMEMDDDNAHLEMQVGRKQESIDMLQVQLSASEDYAAALLNEKTEALRKLTEAKTELALLGARNAKLQKQVAAQNGDDVSRGSCELGRTLNMLSVDTLASTLDNDTRVSSPHPSDHRGHGSEPASPTGSRLVVEAATRSVAEAQGRLEAANKRVELLERKVEEKEKRITQLQAVVDSHATAETGNTQPSAPGTHTAADATAERRLRRLSTHPQPSGGSDEDGDEARTGREEANARRDADKGKDTPAEETGARGRVNNVWRRMYEESVVKMGRLERELSRLNGAAVEAAPSTKQAPPNSPRHDVSALRDECQKLREALTTEQTRNRRLSTSESELLTQVADLARKLREKEHEERTLRAQWRQDAARLRAEGATAPEKARSEVPDRTDEDSPTAMNGSNSRGDHSSSEQAARHRADVLKAFEDMKLQTVRAKKAPHTADAVDSPGTPVNDDAQELSFSPSRNCQQMVVTLTRSPSPPRRRARSGSLMAPPGHLRKSISAVISSTRDPLMNSQKSLLEESGVHEENFSSVSSVASPSASATRPRERLSTDLSTDATGNGLHVPLQCVAPAQTTAAPTYMASQPAPRRSVHGSGGAVPAPVRVPLRIHPALTTSNPGTPRGSRERPIATQRDGTPTTTTALGASYSGGARRGITRGASQDRAPRRRSSSQTAGTTNGKARSSSIRAGAGAAAVPANRRP